MTCIATTFNACHGIEPIRKLSRVGLSLVSRGRSLSRVRVKCRFVSMLLACRTDLHAVEGDLVQHRPGIIPGHEVVGRVAKTGEGCTRFAKGARVGVAWLRGTCGICRFCSHGAEKWATDVPVLNYQEHLFQERGVCSVTANTRRDGVALLELAALIPIQTRTHPYPVEQANQALSDLKEDRIKGASVLLPNRDAA